ncbi:MAG TPA: glycosyltransferase [Candidatus Sulfotelmatobacter sp.]|nr:glycosyltransferase [Candidatus Sulfotelmatobacter sp.]
MNTQKHQQAVQLYQQGRIAEAVRLAALALSEGETAEGWNDWAVMMTAANQAAEAETGYRRALDLDPRFTQAAANLALLLESADRPEEAIPLLKQVEKEQGKKFQPELKAALQQCRARLKDVPRQPDYETLCSYLKLFASTEKNLRIYFEGHLHRYLGTLAFLPPAEGPGRRALELGTAYHYMTPALIRWKGYSEVNCADIWEGEPKCTRQVVSADGKEEYLFSVDNFDLQAPNWPYPDASFDLVLLCEILEHLVSDPMNVISEMNRVLKIGGLLLLTVPNIASAKGVESVLVGESPYIYGKYQPGGRPTDRHNREYAPHELTRLAAAGGFATAKLQTYNSWWKHGSELSRLAAGGFPVALRGDTIFFLGRKESGVRERYPEEFYELTGTQRQRRDVQTSKPAASDASAGQIENSGAAISRRTARVLVVHEILPEYDRSGSEQRHWQVLQALRALGHEVTYVARWAVERERYAVALEDLGIDVYSQDVERLGFQGVSGRPKWSFEQVLKDGRFDVAFLLNWFWTGISIPEQYLDDVRRVSPETRIIVVCDDPHGPREMDLAKVSGKLIDFERAKDYEQREKEIYALADLVVTVSETNRNNLLAMSPNLDIEILPNEAESLIDPSPQPGFESRKDLLFLGDFLNLANRDGLVWFMRDVWPAVRQRLPGIQLDLAGSNFRKGQLPECEGVQPLGFVPDLKPLFGAHRIFISPARYGISTRTKNLSALALGLPLVTTSVGAEGLFLRHEQEALLADSAEEFAEAVCRLYSDANLWNAIAEQGRAHIRKVFSKERLESTLDRIIQRALSLRPKSYDPAHTFSAMLVEKRFPDLKEGKSGRNQMIVRAMCQLRIAEQFLEEGNAVAALEQVRHIFAVVFGELSQNSLSARVLLCLERCYTQLGEHELARRCKEEAQGCLVPAAPVKRLPDVKQSLSVVPRPKSRLQLSVVIPTFNRKPRLEACLGALEQQSLAPAEFELIVVDDGSSDGTEEFCRKRKSPHAFHYFRQANGGAGSARRLGVEHARGEYLVMLNDDSVAAPALLDEHLRAQQLHSREKLAVLGDFRLPPAAMDRALTHFLTQDPFLFPQVSLKAGIHAHSAYFITCNLSVRRDAVLAAGSFDPRFRVAEDTDLGIRLMRHGYRVLYLPEAVAFHDHLPFTIADLLRRAEAYAPAQLLLFQKHPDLLGDGAGPFGTLDELSIRKLREFVSRREKEVSEAVSALEKFDSVDFKPYFSKSVDARTAAEEVMGAFARAVPDIYFFHLYRNFLKAWDDSSARAAGAEAAPQLEEKAVKM